MTDANPQPIYLSDYTPPTYLVDTVELTFRLSPKSTLVSSKIAFRPNPAASSRDFFLHGEEVRLISAKIDGAAVTPNMVDGGLNCDVPDAPFVWEAEVEISPETNTALEGLYMSNGMYCTQCEAEGFRKITYYPDRPDVMAVFTVRIEGDLPVLLSNGNPTGHGDGWAEWHDPWPKPAYLFALVAGDLIAHSDTFTTKSGKHVDLNIYVRPGDEDKCAFGMDALIKSMKWDEDVYGREYDLDIFNIVAVDDFNMGAMENKGLNIFNSSCVLASPETATDNDYERIEAIIAHEYFHNWTGNRITCRDWFQLCLKEGLTVFRDQQFTGDMRSHAVKRVDDAVVLRAHQFREDAGPLAHPVRPASFVEINNFYTVTVYEKGAELIGMLKRLVGDDAYYKALDLYFERHDGEAATIEDWLKVFEDSTGRDMSQFAKWYSQAGTPQLTVTDDFKDGTYTLHFKQETPPTPDQAKKDPVVIPIATGLLNPNGDEVLPTTILEMTKSEQSFSFDGLAARPTPSILREFSAPVILKQDQSNADLAFLLAHDTDPFNRWDAGHTLAKDVLLNAVRAEAPVDVAYLDGLASTLRDDTLSPAFRAQVLTLPTENDTATTMSEVGETPDPLAIYHAHEAVKLQIAQHLQDQIPAAFAKMQVTGQYSADVGDVDKRHLGNVLLGYLSRMDGGKAAQAQYDNADNMTQQLSALAALLRARKGEAALAKFHDQWQHERLVMDKWFGLQVGCAAPDQALDVARSLTGHAAFDWKNPNRFRAVFRSLEGNCAGFHRVDGAAYDFYADWLIRLDPLNPQGAARLTTAFQTWKRYDADRQAKMKSAMERILSSPDLSRDTGEMVGRLLNS